MSLVEKVKDAASPVIGMAGPVVMQALEKATPLVDMALEKANPARCAPSSIAERASTFAGCSITASDFMRKNLEIAIEASALERRGRGVELAGSGVTWGSALTAIAWRISSPTRSWRCDVPGRSR